MPDDVQPSHKYVAVLNKTIPAGKLMDTLARATTGLSAVYPDIAEMRLDDCRDGSEGKHRGIIDNPFIVLRADNSNKLRVLRGALVEQNIHFTDFTSTMTEDTYEEQHESTQATPEAELEYFSIVAYGKIEALNAINKKFSLWR